MKNGQTANQKIPLDVLNWLKSLFICLLSIFRRIYPNWNVMLSFQFSTEHRNPQISFLDFVYLFSYAYPLQGYPVFNKT